MWAFLFDYNALMHLRTLQPADLDDVVDTFHRAFADYVVKLELDRYAVIHMMDRRGADLTASAGAFDGDTMVAVIVVAVDDFEGIPSAYDVFTGVVPEARGQGLARRLFDVSRPVVVERGAQRFLLEVIETNAPAAQAYRAVGFTERRRLRVFMIDEVASVSAAIVVRPTAVEDALRALSERSAAPSWQNADASIRRVADDCVALGAEEAGRVAGLAFVFPRNRDVAQVHVERGRLDVLQALLAAARARCPGEGPMRLVNVDADATWLCESLVAVGGHQVSSQWEMVLPLSTAGRDI